MSAKNSAQGFLKITQIDGPVSLAEVEELYNGLEPVPIDKLLGEWKGGSLNTGHPVHQHLLSSNWAGKTFLSADMVQPIMVYDKDGKRRYAEELSGGLARLREVKFRGVVSTAMIYDTRAVIDYFRYVDENTVAGAMDARDFTEESTYYFYLTRL